MSKADRRRQPERSSLASHVDAMTFAALTVAALLLVATVASLGGSAAADRIGCGLNAYVNAMMAYPRPCHAMARPPRP